MSTRFQSPDESFGLIGSSSAMSEVRSSIHRVATADATVLIVGETGTGKKLVATAIHKGSERKHEQIYTIDCGSLSATLLESELFGHEKGAFCGAEQCRHGKFEHARGGTIFLDEIHSASRPFQSRLLRVVQDKEIVRVGGNVSIQVDVRVIAATNENLAEAVAKGKFREDLYFRLKVLDFSVPPLRQRGDDVIELAEYFLQVCSIRYSRAFKGIAPKAADRLRMHSWPGNVRELQNLIEKAVVMATQYGADKTLDLPGDFEPQFSSVDYKAAVKAQIADIVHDELLGNKPLLEGLRRGSTILAPVACLLLEGIILGLDRYLGSERGQKDVLEVGHFIPRIGLSARRPGSESVFNSQLRERVSQLLEKYHRQRIRLP